MSETILVAEDHDALRRVIRRSLEGAGYTVIAPENSSEALALIRDRDVGFDLLLTDLIMPDVSGEELVRELEASRPQVPAIYMSGYGAISDGGQTPMLGKPFLPEQLVAAVHSALRD